MKEKSFSFLSLRSMQSSLDGGSGKVIRQARQQAADESADKVTPCQSRSAVDRSCGASGSQWVG
jgi:hypothetical protein